MSDYKDLFYHQVSFKASHNSFELAESLSEQLDRWKCRGLELDISQFSDGSKWSVAHKPEYDDSDDRQLEKYLKELNDWSDTNRGHDVITIYLDLKLVGEKFFKNKTFPELLDSYILNNFPQSKIFIPQELIRNRQSLSASVSNKNWGRLRDLENKFIFCLTGNGSGSLIDLRDANEPIKHSYTFENFDRRLCFVDIEKPQDEQPSPDLITKGNRIFFNYEFNQQIDVKIIDKNWTKKLLPYAKRSNVILRTYTLETKEQFTLALNKGFNILSVVEIKESWATVDKDSGKDPFVKSS
jgi:hypothetical protein